MNTYQKTLDAIRFLAQIASQNGWRIPKNRKDLRCKEMIADSKFWKAILKSLK